MMIVHWNNRMSLSESDPKYKLCQERRVEGQACGERKEGCEPRPSDPGSARRGSSARPALHQAVHMICRNLARGFVRADRMPCSTFAATGNRVVDRACHRLPLGSKPCH